MNKRLNRQNFKRTNGMAIAEALIASAILATTIVAVIKVTQNMNTSQHSALVNQLAQFQVKNHLNSFGSELFDSCEQIEIVGALFEKSNSSSTTSTLNGSGDTSTDPGSAGTAGASSSTSSTTGQSSSAENDNSQTASLFSLNCDTAFATATLDGKVFDDVALPKTATVQIPTTGANWSLGVTPNAQ